MVSSSSCSLPFFNREPKTVPIIHTKIIKPTIIRCPKPDTPIYDKLDETKPLTDKDNLTKLLNNISKMKRYCEGLEETIKCYEEQIQSLEQQNQTINHNQKDQTNHKSQKEVK